MVGVGNIVSVGGVGGGGSGGGSGIQELNGQVGPVVTLIGTSGVVITPVAPNQINIGFAGSLVQSGVFGINGIDVHQVDGNFVVDGAALSGLIGSGSGSGCYSASFGPTTSGRFEHNLSTRDVVVQILDDSLPPQQLFPDRVLYDTPDAISVLFNRPQSGRIVILSCGSSGGTSTGTSNRVEIGLEFKAAFSGDTYSEITRVSGQISQIDIWDTSTKTNKLFTKILSRVSGQISQVYLTDEQSAATLVTDIVRDASGVISNLTRTFTS